MSATKTKAQQQLEENKKDTEGANGGEAKPEPKAPPAQKPPKPKLLPDKKTPPQLTADTAKVLLVGAPKIGKTTLAANLDPDHTLILATEPGTGALEAFETPIRTWDEFRAVGAELAEGKHPFKIVVIDTIDELLKMCGDKVLRGLGVKHASDLEYGKGWGAITDEFRLRVGRLASLGLGVWFISHAKDVEIEERVGTYTKHVPSIGGKAGEWVTGFVDFILFAAYEAQGDQGERRVLRTAATRDYEAGGRVTLPDPLPLDAAAVKKAMADACAPATTTKEAKK